MEQGRQVPEDFTSFVATHEHRLRAACNELTGDERLADRLRLELMAAVALHWRWLRLRRARSRARAGEAYLDRLIRHEERTWRPELAAQARSRPARRERAREPDGTAVATAVTTAVTPFARDAWERAHHIRARRGVTVAIVLALLGCVALIGPRPQAPVRLEPLPPAPTAVPAGVRILPPPTRLNQLDQLDTRLPEQVMADPTSVAGLPTLAESPVGRAVAVLRQELGVLIVVAEDGSARRVDDVALAGARLLSTSLSPDGARTALVMAEGVLVVDMNTGAVRPVKAAAAQTAAPILVWRTPRTVLVPGQLGALEVDVDSGAVATVAGVTGVDVLTVQGPSPRQLTELVARSSTAGQSPRIRLWRIPPTTTPTGSNATGSSPAVSPDASPGLPVAIAPTTPARRDVEDRPIFGPIWIGAWLGAGWSSGSTLARACAPGTLALPADKGTARNALGAVSVNGLYVGTLVAVDTTQLEILGFLDPGVVLVSAQSPTIATVVLAWEAASGNLRRVMTVNADVRISVADQLPSS